MPADYFLAPILSYLGLLAGIILVLMSPEEQKPGKRYFTLLKKILFFLSIFVFLFFIGINTILLAFLAVLLALLLSWEKMPVKNDMLAYLIFGIIIAMSYASQQYFMIQSVIVFIYGLPASSFAFDARKKNYLGMFGKNAVFFIPVIIIYLL